MEEQIRKVLDENGNLPVEVDQLRDDDDLYQAGLTSHASVNVMLALEDEFEIEFPESMLRRSTFESVSAIRTAITELSGAGATGPG
jgi:acyl carrier protein